MNNKLSILAVLAALTLVAGLLVVSVPDTALAQTTRWVNDDDPNGGGQSPPGTSCDDPGYSTIQAAVNAASSGDTIKVCPGTYTENVDVTTDNLTIVSTGGSLVTEVDGSGAADEVFEVVADGVTIQGFEIHSGGSDGGILFKGNNNVFADNHVHDNSLYGIVAWDSGVSNNNKITRNEIHDNVRSGILIGFMGNSGNEVTHNDVYDNGASWWMGIELINAYGSSVTHNNVHSGYTMYAGILLMNWTDDVSLGHNAVAHNTVYGDGSGGFAPAGITLIAWTSGGSFHGFPCSDTTVSDNAVVHNNVHDNDAGSGILLWAIADCDSKTAAVADNTVAENNAGGSGNAIHGIRLLGADYNNVHHNQTNNNGFEGIRLQSSSNGNTIMMNQADNNGRDGIRADATSGGNTIVRNSMTSNTEHDAHDEAGAGTTNTWIKNNCTTDSPDGLC